MFLVGSNTVKVLMTVGGQHDGPLDGRKCVALWVRTGAGIA